MSPALPAAGKLLPLLSPGVQRVSFEPCRHIFSGTKTIPVWKRHGNIPNRHKNDLFRKERAWKVLKVDLPDTEFERKRVKGEISPEELKEKMKKLGIQPPSPYMEVILMIFIDD